MLYHKDVYIPKDLLVKLSVSRAPLTWSKHAILAAKNDRYGDIKLLTDISFKSSDVIEVELVGREVVKVLVRLPYDDLRDVMYAIGRGGVVKTVWLNLKSDKHKSLDKTKYERVS